jgi:hypothetical protein
MALSGWKNKLGERWVSRKTADKASGSSLAVDDVAAYRLFNAGTAPQANTALIFHPATRTIIPNDNGVKINAKYGEGFAYYPNNDDPGTVYTNITKTVNSFGNAWATAASPGANDTVNLGRYQKKDDTIFVNTPGWILLSGVCHNMGSAGSFYGLVENDNTGIGGWLLLFTDSGIVEIDYFNSISAAYSQSTTSAISVNTRFNILVTHNGIPTATGHTKIYVNGNDVTSFAALGGAATGSNNGADVILFGGSSNHSTLTPASTEISFFAIGNKLLSPSECKKLSNNPLLVFDSKKNGALLSFPTPSGESLTASITDFADTIAVTASGSSTATPAITAPNDIIAVTASGLATATVAITDLADTIAVNALGAATVTAAITAPNDTIAAAETQSSTATVAITDIADTVIGNASGLATVDTAITDLADTIAVSVSSAGDSVTVAITDSADTIAASDTQTSTATAAITDLTDTIAANASGAAVIDSAITAPNDTIAAAVSDVVFLPVDVAITDTTDTVAATATGQASTDISITDSRDTISLAADGLPPVANTQAGRPKKRRRIINGINYEVTDAEAMALIQKFQDELSKPEKKVKRTKKTLEKTNIIDYPTDNQARPEQIKPKILDIADIKPLTAQYDSIADQAIIRQMEAEYARMQKEIEDEIDDELALLMLL